MTVLVRIYSAILASACVLVLTHAGALAQPQSKDQQKCINALNKDGAKVAATQGKENTSCIKNAGKGKESAPQACLTQDSKGKVSKAASKVQSDFDKKCTAETPDFGVPGVAVGTAAAVATAATDEELLLVAEVFGSPLGDAIDTSKDGAGCQSAVSKDYEKIAATAAKVFLKCKKSALKAGASDAASLVSCVQSLPGDAKVIKAVSKLAADVDKKCDGVSLGTAFPGACAGRSADFSACVGERVTCRVCRMLNQMDNLAADCDDIDDGSANDSCEDSVVVVDPPDVPTTDTTANVTALPCNVSSASLQASTEPHQYIESDNGTTRSIDSNGIPNHDVGVFPNGDNPNTISAQSQSYTMPVTPSGAGEDIGQIFGIAQSGVLFDPFTGELWNDDPNWRYEALRYATAPDYFQSNGGDDSTGHPSGLGVDCNYAHVQPSGKYHYHGVPEEMLPASAALTFLGWAGDGYPVFGRWGYVDANDSGSGLESMTSSYGLRSGSRGGGAPSGEYDGTFVDDWQYQAGSGDLDECNGRTGVVTINGNEVTTYHYYVTDTYPYIPRCFHAAPDSSFDAMMGPP